MGGGTVTGVDARNGMAGKGLDTQGGRVRITDLNAARGLPAPFCIKLRPGV